MQCKNMLPGRAVAQAQGDTCMVSDVLCYEDLLDEALGLILEHNFNVFKTLSCDRSNAVSATGPTQ